MLNLFVAMASAEPVRVLIVDPRHQVRAKVMFVDVNGRTRSEQVELWNDGSGVVDLPPDAGPLLVARVDNRMGAAWRPTAVGGAAMFNLGVPDCVYLDADHRPIPGLAIGTHGSTVRASWSGEAPCTAGLVVLPGGVAVSVPPEPPEQSGKVVLPVRRVDLPAVGVLITPEGAAGDDGHTALGRWLPIGAASEDRVGADGLVRRTVDVPAAGPLGFGPDTPAPGFVLSPADPSITAWGLRAGDWSAVPVSAREVVVYPTTWPAVLRVWGSGGLWGEVDVAEGQTRAVATLGPDARLREIPVEVAELKKRVIPDYPPGVAAGADRVRCRLRFYVDEEGIPYDVGFPDCPEPYRAASRDALLRWRWYPVTEGADGGLRAETIRASAATDPPRTPVRGTFEIIMVYARD